ncbi:hypothetical protein ACFP3U_13345 [Kitasatospora misakiensis]|uniref:Uncharacterized protein n=1 Tax=Kitasatospora misakiensis TaxID=67330 RepID=A0ABW0X0J9_9ACTN
MAYDTGARVRLTRDVQVTGHGTAGGAGGPGPLFLGGGLAGTVTGVGTQAGGGGGRDYVAEFDQQVRGVPLTGFAAGLVDDLRQKVVRAQAAGAGGGVGPGAGTRTVYRVRFENGFVLDGLEEDALTPA